MISLEAMLTRVSGLDETRLKAWIKEGWVRPDQRAGQFVFQEIDVARCRLIIELEQELEVNEAAMPVVLHLLDQLHQARRQLRRLAEALDRARSPHDG
ncbi:chaperone modulator CbpM [Roseomonas xinghualingensis]|uniref:chaperone modulator CbpM n=1 Tax=Roseomonas xinghualingensis TaxID=2986475 RepID=UPI0021F0DE60|nr:chaperone modulator CbpM [Roseomonas sp. SXEYE001]MCV4205992.1 chaperone modulator CbpM [Roseomonas sp. SXEYE001]